MKRTQKQKIMDLMLEPSTFALGLEVAKGSGYSVRRIVTLELNDGDIVIDAVMQFEKKHLSMPLVFGFYIRFPYDKSKITLDNITIDACWKEVRGWSARKLVTRFWQDLPLFLYALGRVVGDNMIQRWKKRKSRI